MARFRIVHTGQPPGAPLMLERRALAEAGVDAEVISYGKRATPEQVLEAARDASGWSRSRRRWCGRCRGRGR
jgi:hypothetical protein